MNIYVGLDLGCTGCKAIAIDNNGKMRAAASIRYDGTLIARGNNAYDQDPSVLREAGLECLKKLISNLNGEEVQTIGVTAQMHSLVALNAERKVLRPMISCVDARNDAQIQEIYEKCGGIDRFLAFTNNRMVASCTGGKILWMKEKEPELFEQTDVVITPKDYFRLILTGETATDESDASGYGLYDVKNRCWSRELLECIGIPESILPEVKHSNAYAGNVLPQIAEELHISKNTRVVMGGGDAIVQTAGAGAVEKGINSVVLGSGGNISATSDSFYENREGNIQFYAASVPEMWVAYAGIMSVGNTTNWFRSTFTENNAVSFDKLEEYASNTPAGSNGLIFFPSMLGQRNPVEDTNAKGIFLGLDIEHHIGHMFRSVLEGIAMGMREVSETIIPACGKPELLVLSGGGAENGLWCQIFADVFQIPVKRVENGSYCGAKGAAILGMGCDRNREGLQELFKNNETEQIWEPNRKNAAVYDDLFEIFKTIYAANKEEFARIKSFREKYDKNQ